MSGVRWHQRVFVAGYTGSGKSGLLNHLASHLHNQVLLLDTKPEFVVDDVEAVHDVEAIDWSAPLIHYIPRTRTALAEELDDYDRLFHAALRRRNLTIVCHELADLCADQPNRTPAGVRAYLRKGNIYGNGLFGASQRPVGMPRQARTEAQHVFAMVPALDPEDHAIVAKLAQLSKDELYEHLQRAQRVSPTGRHSFVWVDRDARTVRISEPLPDRLRAASPIRQRALGA